MSEHPPKKKLRQISLTEMFMPSSSKGNKERYEAKPPNPGVDSDSSRTIESSIECMKLDSTLSDSRVPKDKQPVEVKKQQDKFHEALNYKEDYPNREHRKSAGNCSRKDMSRSHEKANFEEEGTSHKRKNKQAYDEENEKHGGGRRSGDSKGSGSKGQGKAATQKLPKKLTTRKSPKRSPYKEKDGHQKTKEASDLRSILASAAEKRMKSAVPSSSGGAEGAHSLSPDMFEDEDGDNRVRGDSEVQWRGSPLSDLTRLNCRNLNLPPVSPSHAHTVLVKLPLPQSGPPLPHPSSYSDVWDQYHVRMPCSPKSQYPLSKDSDVIVSRWSVICQALLRDMKNVEDLQRTILEYNTRYASKWKFRGLQYLLERELEEEESEHFFNHTLPAMAHLALRLPKLVTQPPPLLTQHSTHSITLSQLQIASLLANAFFCTYPRRNAKGSDTEYASFPDINFNRLFFHKEKRALEKMKCILNYFRRVTVKEPSGNVTFTRQHVRPEDSPSWLSCSNHLPKLHVDTAGLIEEAEGLLQVDFANKFLGGGVLGLGCVQEEIRFVLSPELLVSRLFTQALDITEALFITGVEQFNLGNGYASTFCWGGSHTDSTPVDLWGRRLCQVTAIDALHFTKQPRIQYRPSFIERELNKAYAGFRVLDKSAGDPIAVATGNWGCGAFKGNPRLKALIQLAACGYIGRDLAYFTFGDEKLRDDLITMYIFLKENNVTVGELVQVVNQHGERGWADGSDLYPYIYHNLGSFDSDTDTETTDTTDLPANRELSKPEKSHKTQERPCTGTISDYFKSVPSPGPSSSRSSASHYKASSLSKRAQSPDVTESGTAPKDSLSEEKILQVLSECERLIEGEKGKKDKASVEHSSAGGDRQARDTSDTVKSQGEKRENHSKEVMRKEENNKDKVLKSTSEPSRLFSILDEIEEKVT